MAIRTFDFRPPAWRFPARHHLHTGAVLLGTALWAALYAWLALRLFHSGPAHMGRLSAALIALCVILGVALFLGWRVILTRWIGARRQRTWPALSLEEMHRLSPSEFEAYVADRLFARQGYAVDNTRDVKDGGIDILVTDRSGRRAVVQCKRYKGTVGEAVVRDLYGTMIHADATMAYLVTTGTISDDARRWAAGKPIGLLDGTDVVRLSHAEPEAATT